MPTSKTASIWYEGLLITAVFVGVHVISSHVQVRISGSPLHPIDGTNYLEVAESLLHGQAPSARKPFVYRVGTPLLAALARPHDLITGFYIVNILASALAVFLLAVWLQLHVDSKLIRTLLVLLYIGCWHAPVRFVHFYPHYVDPWAFVFLLVGLISIESCKSVITLRGLIGLSLLSSVAVLFREIGLVIPLAFAFVDNPISDKLNLRVAMSGFRRCGWSRFVPLGAALLTLAVVQQWCEPTGTYSFARVAATFAYDRPLLRYAQGWFVAFGPLLILAVFRPRERLKWLRHNQPLLIYLIAFAILGWIGGTDTDRILFWAAPVVFLAAANTLDSVRTHPAFIPFAIVWLAAQSLAFRMFWRIPEYPSDHVHVLPLFTPFGGNVPYLDCTSFYVEPVIGAISLAQNILMGILLYGWLARMRKGGGNMETKGNL